MPDAFTEAERRAIETQLAEPLPPPSPPPPLRPIYRRTPHRFWRRGNPLAWFVAAVYAFTAFALTALAISGPPHG